MAEVKDSMLQGTVTTQVAVFCMNSEGLECVHEDVMIIIDQAPHDMCMMHGSGN